MDTKLYTNRWGEMSVHTSYPKDREALIFPGRQLQMSHSHAKGYYYLLQQFETSLFTIRFYYFYSKKKDVFRVTTGNLAIIFRLGVVQSIFTGSFLKKDYARVALISGYSDPRQFVNDFTKRFGYPPIQKVNDSY